MLGGLASDGNVEEGLEVSYLYWEKPTRRVPPPLPLCLSFFHLHRPSPLLPPFNPSTASLSQIDTILLSTSQVTSHLDKSVKALGLHVEGRTSFTYWLPSFLKHTHLLLRFLPQDFYSQAAPLELSPSADVATRISLLFRQISTDEAGEGKWDSAWLEGEREDFESWREVVGVASRQRQEDASLLRVEEWGGMEVLS
ncbi:hypothetical protein BDY24DRAFT_414923 [Mrakia frigida]|uniref:uncharacterized protein n=1 Tax=Mrakia frigida TaxID=29902 RepID=UPI003FCC1464